MNIIFLLNTGPGLVFEVYPEAIGTLPGSQIWSFLFFLTVIMLGMDSAVNTNINICVYIKVLETLVLT